MSNSGRKISTPGWCTFALLGGVMVAAFGAFASATPRDKAEATLVPAADKTAASTLVDQAAAVADQRKAAGIKEASLLASSSGTQAGSSATLSTARPGAASTASLTEVQQPRGNRPTTLSGTSLSSDATRTAMGGPGDWTEDWESYFDGSCMHGQGGWKGWDNSPAWDACLQEAISRSPNSAIDIVADADLVHPFSGHSSGVWNLYAYQWVPDDLNAPSGQYFIVQKEYNDGGPYQWSIQMWVATDGSVHCDCGAADNGIPMNWIPNAWNEIHAVIDLDNDWVELFYNGALLGAYQWTAGVFGTDSGCPAFGCIGAIDLFAFGGSSVYYDDLSITEKIPTVCGDGTCEGSEDSCNCPQDCGAETCNNGICCEEQDETCENCEADCGICSTCTIFTNQAEFEAFNQEEFKALKGIEDFEESTLPGASITGMDDPLCGGVPGTPPGSPFPDGLLQLNMCVQANILGANPTDPAPHSPAFPGQPGLAVASAGFLDMVSDVVLANYYVDSWDLMLTSPPAEEEDDHTGVGFNGVSSNTATGDIRVFNKSNVLLETSTMPVSPAASAFWGIWCADPIGRINIFDPSGGAEGGDNIQLWLSCGDPEFCGNGVCCGAIGEDCTTCPQDCGACTFCGDGNVDPDEECDPPGSLCPNGEFCEPDCTCPRPENDDCEDKTVILDGITPIDTTAATTDGLPTNGMNDCAGFGQPQIEDDLWYCYEATCTGTVFVSTCDTVDYDSKIAIYEGCDSADCPRGGDEIGCNDDGAICANFTSLAEAPVTEGQLYNIRIGGFTAGAGGVGTVEISCGVCGDGACEGAEDCCSCPGDCGGCDCGDGICDAPCEDTGSCPGDCPLVTECVHDDGSTEDALGLTGASELAWIQQCDGGGNTVAVEAIKTTFGTPGGGSGVSPGDAVRTYVWSDPDQDGTPVDSVLLCETVSTVDGASIETDVFQVIPLNPACGVITFEAGESFFIGASVVVNAYEYPMPMDQTEPLAHQSWVHWGGPPYDPNTVGAAQTLDAVGFPADWLLRASFAAVCDPECEPPAICIQGACCGDGVVEGHEQCDPAGCGTCPWDVDDDGKVGPFDLATLLGNWTPPEGPPPPGPDALCLDANGDGEIGPFDLASLLGNWGCCCGNQDPECDPVPPPCGDPFGEDQCVEAECLENCECAGRGACCGGPKGPDTCDDGLTADECAAAGGSYAGDDTACIDEPCPNPACFDAEESCFEPHEGIPGCSNVICCGIVCDIDPECCSTDTGWDKICVGLAEKNCPPPECGDGACDPGESECGCPSDCGADTCGNGICCESVGETCENCAADCDVCPDCTIFTNQAEFEAFNAEEGKALKGIEDFEETPPGSGIIGFDDPLCGGIPNGPFANGLDQLNLCVQSNFEHGWANPNPRVTNALVFVELGAGQPNSSDIVAANYFVDSLDVMLTTPPVPPGEEDDHTGVGFNPVTILGSTTADIRVFNKNNTLMVEVLGTPNDAAGSNFWGVWCSAPIGRINIFDPGNGAEGGDNIQLWVNAGLCGDGKCTAGEDCENCPQDCEECPICGNGVIEPGEECDPPGGGGCGDEVCLADCTCGDLCGDNICSAGENQCNCSADCPGACEITEYTNQAEFEAAMAGAGKTLKGIETFEEGNLPPASVAAMTDPLCGGIPCGPAGCPYPNGLDQMNLCLQSNLGGANPASPNPRGVEGLAAASVGFLGAASDVVLANTFVDGLDLIFDDPKTGVGFDVLNSLGLPSVVIKVYDTANVEILSTGSPADSAGTSFWGVLSNVPIGRINIYDTTGAEGGDNIQLWMMP